MACRRPSAADRCRPWPCTVAPSASRWRHQRRIEPRRRLSHLSGLVRSNHPYLSAPSGVLLPCTDEIPLRSAIQELFQLRRAQGLRGDQVDTRENGTPAHGSAANALVHSSFYPVASQVDERRRSLAHHLAHFRPDPSAVRAIDAFPRPPNLAAPQSHGSSVPHTRPETS